MNSKVAPITEMCVHYLKEIKKGRINVDQWYKAFRKRGVSPDLLATPESTEVLIGAIERIKEAYATSG